MDDEHCYRVASGRDGRFDGMFVTAVLTTGIYCRPSCPAMTPRRRNVRFYPTPATAQEAGFRSCKRCRPDSAPGSPEWDARADVVARAVRLIADGVVEREGIAGLAGRLGYSTRQLHRLVSAEIGTGPLRLAVAHRAQNARTLLETTDLPVTEVAWAAGFASIRRFNELIRDVHALSPSEIRAAAGRRAEAAAPGEGGQVLVARLAYRPPMDLEATLRFLGRRAAPGAEEWDGRTYRAVLRLPHGLGVVTVPAATAGGPAPPSRASSASTTCATTPPPWPGCAGCSTSTPTQRRWPPTCQPTPCSARRCAPILADGSPERPSPPRCDTGRARPAGLRRRGPVSGRAPYRHVRHAAGRAGRLAPPGLRLPRGAGRSRPGDVRAAPTPGRDPAHPGHEAGLGGHRPRPGLRPGLGRARGAAGAGTVTPEAWKPWRSYAALHLWASDEAPQPQQEELS